MPKLWL